MWSTDMLSVIKRLGLSSCAAACGMVALGALTSLTTLTGVAAAPKCDPDNGGLKLPADFCALVVAEAVGTARHLVIAPNGDLYVALRGQTPGGIVALRDTDGDGKFETKEPFGKGSTTG